MVLDYNLFRVIVCLTKELDDDSFPRLYNTRVQLPFSIYTFIIVVLQVFLRSFLFSAHSYYQIL